MIGAYSYYLTIHQKVQEFCRPLQLYLGLKHFGYLKIFSDSNYIHISNDPDLTKSYMEKINKSEIFFEKFLCSEQNKQYKFILWPKEPKDRSMEIYIDHRYWYGFTIAKFIDDSALEMWWFATDLENQRTEEFYYQHSNLLLSFVENFNREFTEKIDHNKIVMAKYCEGFTFNLPHIDKERINREQIKQFIRAVFPKGLEVKCRNSWQKVTEREVDCLSILAEGKTMKEISNELSLSARTVETHLQNLQTKTGYHLRSDLIKLFNQQIKHLLVE